MKQIFKGKVITQVKNIFRIIRKFKASIPRAKPTPNTPPTSVCVAETAAAVAAF